MTMTACDWPDARRTGNPDHRNPYFYQNARRGQLPLSELATFLAVFCLLLLMGNGFITYRCHPPPIAPTIWTFIITLFGRAVTCNSGTPLART